MLKLTDPLLTRAESKAISVFRLRMPAGILRLLRSNHNDPWRVDRHG